MRWLKILTAMLRDNAPNDAALHDGKQLQSGSWVLQLPPHQPAEANAS
jgi:hypothetical protein